MFDNIITYSVKNKFMVGLMVLALIIWGVYSLKNIPIDAVPDITNNQVQIMTISPTLATQEIEQFITTPIELSLQNLQNIEEIRSISRFGLSVVTVVFEEGYDIYLARQLVNEQLDEAQEDIPEGLGKPELAPISTGLGEIYQYAVKTEKGYEDKYNPTELRSIQDWIVKRQLSGIPGVAEINSIGGYLKQYEVAVNPELLKSMNINITDVYEALANSNENTGGAYIERNPNTYYIRSEGISRSLDDIGNIVISDNASTPILIKDIAKVQYGKAPRYGALVMNGQEVVGGKVMMFKGANSAAVTELVKERVIQIQKSLPEGVVIEPYLVRDKLVKSTIKTVKTNLIEGGLIVIFILVLMLGNWRAGLIVASVIPLAMLFAVSLMRTFGISANLMSLGAIDFGLIVDGAVIIVESIVHRLRVNSAGKKLSQVQMDEAVTTSSQKIRSSAAFGEIIILMVYIPILALVGIEGKMFKPMAQTVMLAIAGALILSLTYVPMMSALFLKKTISDKKTVSDYIMSFFQWMYLPVLKLALRFKAVFVLATIALFVVSFMTFSKMGGEFIPTLEEGDLAMQQILPPGSSLSQSIETAKLIELKLLDKFPEIEDVVVNIGSAEIPTDPMPVEIGDYVLVMKPKSEWTSASTRQGMFREIEKVLGSIPGIGYEFSQPIQLRFNELMTGTKADIAIKLYGEDLDLMYTKAKESQAIINAIPGVGTANVEQTVGMPQVIITYQYDKMAQYGLHVKEVNQVVRTAFAGEKAGVIYEGEKRFDLVIRLDEAYRKGIDDIKDLFITLGNGSQVPLSSVANIDLVNAPMQISRENTNRSIVIGVNVGNTDVESLVKKIQTELDTKVELPSGYYFTYGGQFENLKAANARLAIALPLALALIFILLYFTFKSIPQALLIYTAIPLSAIGGVWALELRHLPFSISAGIGFIALFGVAVLNGIVLIGYFNELKTRSKGESHSPSTKSTKEQITNRIIEGSTVRLRPVIMTAAVASLGFLPMAISTSGGAEVQRPLATVVIGGLITATFLTLIILPILYSWLEQWNNRKTKKMNIDKNIVLILLMTCFGFTLSAQQPRPISLENAMEKVMKQHPSLISADLEMKHAQSLQNMKYQPGETEFTYQGDGLFKKNGQRVNQVGVVQHFPHPAAMKAQNNLQTQQISKSSIKKELSIRELKFQLEQLYMDIQYKKQFKGFYQEQIDLYATYLAKANLRVKAGDTNKIEPLTIESKMKEYELLLRQVGIEVANLEIQMQAFIQSDEAVTSQGDFKVLRMEEVVDISNPWLQQIEQEIEIEKAKISILEASTKPTFNIGYALQHYHEGGILNGLQAGVQIPLFKKQVKQKIEAQQVNVELVASQIQQSEWQMKQQIISAESAMKLYAEGMNYYQEQAKTLNPELIRVTQLNYQAGEVSYLELLHTLNIASDNQLKYWEQAIAYNKAIIYYQFLTK